MDRTPVSSSNLASVGYDPSTKTLEIEFNDGAVYQYDDVPESEYTGLSCVILREITNLASLIFSFCVLCANVFVNCLLQKVFFHKNYI